MSMESGPKPGKGIPAKGYSLEKFKENEKKIDAARPLADQKPFAGRADPSDIMGAKFDVIAGRQERARLLDLAQEDALKEDTARTLNKMGTAPNTQEKNMTRVGDFKRIVLVTESGNRYIVQKDPKGGYLVANFNAGTIEAVPANEIENSTVTVGQQLFFGKGAHTSPIKSGQRFS